MPISRHQTAVQDEVTRRLSDKVEELFSELHSRYDTTGGDIDPEQEMILSDLTEKMSKIISDQISQNIPPIIDPEISELRELSGI